MSNEFNPTDATDADVLAWGEQLSDQQKAEAKNQALYNRWLELQKPKKAPDYNDDEVYRRAVRDMPWTTNG